MKPVNKKKKQKMVKKELNRTNITLKISKIDKLRRTLTELAKEVNIQFIAKVFSSKRFGFKLMWLILLIGSSIACAYYVTKCTVEYLEYEYLTSIKTIVDTPAIFPTVSICNYKDTEFELNFLHLEFDSNILTNWKKYFEPFNDSIFGRCYRFNSGFNYTRNVIPLNNSTSSGDYFGLWFDLYLGGKKKDFSQILIYIHNSTQAPLSLINKAYYLSSGNYNYFVIKRIFEEKLPEPYNSCFKDVNLFPYNKTLIDFIQKNKTYSQKQCLELCRTMKFMESGIDCNRSIKSYDDNLLTKNALANCTSNFIKKFQKKNPFKQCADYCPLECDSFDLETYFFFEDIPSSGSIDNSFDYPEFKTYENVSKNFISIAVYYEDLKYTLITQKPIFETFDLVSNIGGLFGLFLGMGLLSFIEIFELLFETLLIFYGK